jgi:hypothetical protein
MTGITTEHPDCLKSVLLADAAQIKDKYNKIS